MRSRYLLLADVLAIALAAWGAFAFRFGWLFYPSREEFLSFLVVAIVIKLPVFFAFGLYQRYWRYAGFWDLLAVALANSAASVLFGAVMVGLRLAGAIDELSRSVLPIDWLLALAMTSGIRASLRALEETMGRHARQAPAAQRRVLIIGAGDAGTLVAREMQKNPQLGMKPVGFLDDEPGKVGKRIYGLPVLGPLSKLSDVADTHSVDEVVIAIPRAGGDTVRAVVEMCRRQALPSRAMPGIFELLDGNVGLERLRGVDIADLLRRPQVESPMGVAGYLKGATVIVSGAGGSIGSELCRQVAHSGPRRLVLLGHGENSIFQIASELRVRFPSVSIAPVIADVRDRDRMLRVFRTVRPDIVFHAAAHKHVTLMEENISEAVTNNIAGTRNVVDAASSAGTLRFVLVSTDKAVAPTSVMGASKRVAEMIVRDAAKRLGRAYVVVRFGNVLGSRGSVVPIFKEQIERGGPVTVTHPDVRRYFMTIPEAVHLILQAGGFGRGGELFVLDMGEPVLLRELAADMVRLSGFRSDEIPIVFTGLRPGEKLNESLWEPGADVSPTTQADIRVVEEPDEGAPGELATAVDRLVDAASRDENARIVRLLADCIPTASLTSLPMPWGPGRKAAAESGSASA